MTKAPEPDLIGTAQAAKIVGVNRSTLTRLVERGEVRAFKPVPGERTPLLFDRSEVEAFALAYAERKAS